MKSLAVLVLLCLYGCDCENKNKKWTAITESGAVYSNLTVSTRSARDPSGKRIHFGINTTYIEE